MSRNIGNTSCEICASEVRLEEEPHPVTREETGPYWDEYRGLLVVANASCVRCGAKYLAWVRHHWSDDYRRGVRQPEGGQAFVDLSFRSSFDDEPGSEDLPDPGTLLRVYRERALVDVRRLLLEAQELLRRAEHRIKESQDGISPWEVYRR